MRLIRAFLVDFMHLRGCVVVGKSHRETKQNAFTFAYKFLLVQLAVIKALFMMITSLLRIYTFYTSGILI